MFNEIAKQEVKEYQENDINLDSKGNVIKPTQKGVKQMVITICKYNPDIDNTDENKSKLVIQLINEFTEVGLYGRGEIYVSPSLTKVRSNTDTSCESVKDSKDVVLIDNKYYFNCFNDKVGVVAKTKLIVKGATAGDLYPDSEQPNSKLTWNDIKEHFKIIEPVAKPTQATTKK